MASNYQFDPKDQDAANSTVISESMIEPSKNTPKKELIELSSLDSFTKAKLVMECQSIVASFFEARQKCGPSFGSETFVHVDSGDLIWVTELMVLINGFQLQTEALKLAEKKLESFEQRLDEAQKKLQTNESADWNEILANQLATMTRLTAEREASHALYAKTKAQQQTQIMALNNDLLEKNKIIDSLQTMTAELLANKTKFPVVETTMIKSMEDQIIAQTEKIAEWTQMCSNLESDLEKCQAAMKEKEDHIEAIQEELDEANEKLQNSSIQTESAQNRLNKIKALCDAFLVSDITKPQV